jgi:hypothetical protein
VNTKLDRLEIELFATKHIALFVAIASLGATDAGTSAFASTSNRSRSRCEAWDK